jgi:hypothetical protein
MGEAVFCHPLTFGRGEHIPSCNEAGGAQRVIGEPGDRSETPWRYQDVSSSDVTSLFYTAD